MFLQSIYHPFRLMATASHEVAVTTFVDSGTHAHADPAGERWTYRVADLGPFQLVDVAASRDAESRRLTISVVNRDPERELSTRVRLLDAAATGTMTVHEVNGSQLEAANSFAHPGDVSVNTTKHEVGGERIGITFAPHSFTLLEVDLA